MESLTAEELTEIDSLILGGSIIAGMKQIMKACQVSLPAARDLFKARYRQLREKRGTEFACGDEQYWACYFEDFFGW